MGEAERVALRVGYEQRPTDLRNLGRLADHAASEVSHLLAMLVHRLTLDVLGERGRLFRPPVNGLVDSVPGGDPPAGVHHAGSFARRSTCRATPLSWPESGRFPERAEA